MFAYISKIKDYSISKEMSGQRGMFSSMRLAWRGTTSEKMKSGMESVGLKKSSGINSERIILW